MHDEAHQRCLAGTVGTKQSLHRDIPEYELVNIDHNATRKRLGDVANKNLRPKVLTSHRGASA